MMAAQLQGKLIRRWLRNLRTQVTPLNIDDGRRHGPMAGRHIFAANESIFVIHSAIDSPALGGLKTGWVLANSTARQTEV
jgi:hypothetical protein